MTQHAVNRRDFLKFGMAAGTATALTAGFPRFSPAAVKPTPLSDCMDMTPEDMAGQSRLVMDAWKYILDLTATIENPETREMVQGILRHPAPTFMADLMDAQNRKDAYMELTALGYTEDTAFEAFLPPTENPYKSPHPFIAGPGSGYFGHHSYPGGLVTHTALNAMTSVSLLEGYKNVYGFSLDRDTVIASQVLHDVLKPWVFQWQETGESRVEKRLADTGEHHPCSIAEAIHRGLPARICVAQACAHNHPGWEKDEAGPVSWLTAAAVLTGKDPVAYGLLSPDRASLPQPRQMENFICHLGDHDWVLSVPAARWIIPVMKEIAVENYGMTEQDLTGRTFNQLRNYVFAQASIMGLYEIYSTRGKDALAHTTLAIVSPA